MYTSVAWAYCIYYEVRETSLKKHNPTNNVIQPQEIIMAKNTTKYNVLVAGEVVATKTKKAQALELANATRDADKVAVQVVTTAGTEVLNLAAPKKIRMSPRYTKVQALPAGVELAEDIAGLRVAYVRPQRNGAILHDPEAEAGKQYVVADLKTGKAIKQRFAKTREAGAFLNDGVGARRKELAAQREAKAAELVSA